MNTGLTMLAVSLAAISTATWADSALEVYGKINVTVEHVDSEVSGDKVELVSNSSRFGIKGDLAISEGFEAFYQLEWEVDPADKDKGSNDNIKSRNQIVGLRGAAGTILAGRHDTPLKVAQNKIDLFNDYVGDIKKIFNGENRASNIVQYSTPSFSGFKANLASALQEGKNGNDGALDAASVSAEWSNKTLYFAIAHDSGIETYTNINANPNVIEDVETLRLVGQFKLNDWQFGLMWQESDNGVASTDGLLGSVGYKLGDHTLKAQHGLSDTVTKGASQTSIGWDYKLGKSITTTVFYTVYDADDKPVNNGMVAQGQNNLGAGLEVKF